MEAGTPRSAAGRRHLWRHVEEARSFFSAAAD